MRYCPQCGNELNAGAAFCHNCGANLKAFGSAENGAPVAAMPVAVNNRNAEAYEEKDFLDTTHRLLRWERTAWSIAGKVFLIVGIVFAALFMFIGIMLVAIGVNDEFAMALGLVMIFAYSIFFGGMFIVIGIVNNRTAEKISRYTDTLYQDLDATYRRCNSVGMIVFGAFFNTIAMVFYIINFTRMKNNTALAERILAKQRNR